MVFGFKRSSRKVQNLLSPGDAKKSHGTKSGRKSASKSSSGQTQRGQSFPRLAPMDDLDILVEMATPAVKERSYTDDTVNSDNSTPAKKNRPSTVDIVLSTDDNDFTIFYSETPSSCGFEDDSYRAKEQYVFSSENYQYSTFVHDEAKQVQEGKKKSATKKGSGFKVMVSVVQN